MQRRDDMRNQERCEVCHAWGPTHECDDCLVRFCRKCWGVHARLNLDPTPFTPRRRWAFQRS